MQRSSYALYALALLVVTALPLMLACGGDVKSASNTPAAPAPASPTPPSGGGGTPPPPPTPTPAPTPQQSCSSGGQFQQGILISGGEGGHGSVNVNTNGDVCIQATGAQASASYNWRFCPVTTDNTPCFDLGQTQMTDASGNGVLNFHFPKSGKWAGYFEASSGTTTLSTQNATQVSMSAIFMTRSQLNGTAPCPLCRQEPIQSGNVTVANGVAHIVINGADPSVTYEVNLAGGMFVILGNIVTDAGGNATADVPVKGAGSVFGLWNHTNAGFASGFQVP